MYPDSNVQLTNEYCEIADDIGKYVRPTKVTSNQNHP